ncbi:MAG: DMT family transporter [Cyanobacteria bacterium P01_H01_bin.153]
MALVFGLFTALGFGIGDFLAGFATRRVPAMAVVFSAKIIGGTLLLFAALILGGRVNGVDILWATAAGVALGLGSIAYYRALASGCMGLVAALTGLWSALVPFCVGLLLGERPALLAVGGVVTVTVAIALVSGSAGKKNKLRSLRGVSLGLAEATLAGVLFGLFFILLDQAQNSDAIFAAAAAMLAAAVTVMVPGLLMSPTFRPTREFLIAVVGVGICSGLATLCFILAVRNGLLSIVAVAGALSPIPTAACARLFLAEQLTGRQLSGFILAIVGIVLMAIA